jgi:hypothetical protein
MAYDPSHEAALERIANVSPVHAHNIHEIAGHREYELKLAFEPKGVHFLTPKTLIAQAETTFYGLMGRFNCAASGINMAFDPKGFIPNNYILTSLGLDTYHTLPTAEFFLNAMQYRLRFPVMAHSAPGATAPIDLTQLDANLKEHLSSMLKGQHRIELERTISNPLQSLAEFKSLEDIPNFVRGIHDNSLRVSAICMTSRTSFFVLAKVPHEDVHILLHGCYDVSQFTTPRMEVYASKRPRIEIELEAKMLIGDDPSLSEEAVQNAYINRVFSRLTASAIQHGYLPASESKMEAAESAVAGFYAHRIPTFDTNNSPVHSHFRRNDIPPYLAYALTQGVTVSDVFLDVAKHGHNAPLVRLTAGLPEPSTLLSNAKFGLSRLEAA